LVDPPNSSTPSAIALGKPGATERGEVKEMVTVEQWIELMKVLGDPNGMEIALHGCHLNVLAQDAVSFEHAGNSKFSI
jgi:hypothetical protein